MLIIAALLLASAICFHAVWVCMSLDSIAEAVKEQEPEWIIDPNKK